MSSEVGEQPQGNITLAVGEGDIGVALMHTFAAPLSGQDYLRTDLTKIN